MVVCALPMSRDNRGAVVFPRVVVASTRPRGVERRGNKDFLGQGPSMMFNSADGKGSTAHLLLQGWSRCGTSRQSNLKF